MLDLFIFVMSGSIIFILGLIRKHITSASEGLLINGLRGMGCHFTGMRLRYTETGVGYFNAASRRAIKEEDALRKLHSFITFLQMSTSMCVVAYLCLH